MLLSGQPMRDTGQVDKHNVAILLASFVYQMPKTLMSYDNRSVI